MAKNSYNGQKLGRVQKRVKDIKGFYTHLMVYLLINVTMTIVHLWLDSKGFFGENPYGINYWGTPLAWGIGLLIHGINVFKLSSWEDRKVKELMNDDNADLAIEEEVEGSWWE